MSLSLTKSVDLGSLSRELCLIYIYIYMCVCVIGLNIISTKCLPYLRVACACLLRANNDAFLATFALKCSSFCQMNTATSKRTPCSSTGYSEYQSVRYSNTLAERRSTGFYNETKQRSSPPPIAMCIALWPCQDSALDIPYNVSWGSMVPRATPWKLF